MKSSHPLCVCVRVSDWQQAVKLAVLDCAQEINYDVCKEYNIQLYPTFKVSNTPTSYAVELCLRN